jgi:hypothetical protein
MKKRKNLFLMILCLSIITILTGCYGGPCNFSGTEPLTVYRLPDLSSDVFGTLSGGETHEILAYTADGWIGFDPGFAQAGNIGLAHHRWVQMNATIRPSCLVTVDEVTLADVMVDMVASGH